MTPGASFSGDAAVYPPVPEAPAPSRRGPEKRASAGQPRVELVGGVSQRGRRPAARRTPGRGRDNRAGRAGASAPSAANSSRMTGVRSISWWSSMSSAASDRRRRAPAATPRLRDRCSAGTPPRCGCWPARRTPPGSARRCGAPAASISPRTRMPAVGALEAERAVERPGQLDIGAQRQVAVAQAHLANRSGRLPEQARDVEDGHGLGAASVASGSTLSGPGRRPSADAGPGAARRACRSPA